MLGQLRQMSPPTNIWKLYFLKWAPTQIGNMTETMHFSLILNRYVQIQEKVKTNYLKIIIFVIEAKWPEKCHTHTQKKDRENNKTQTQQTQFVNTSINRQIPYWKIVSAGWKREPTLTFTKCYIKTYRQIEVGDGNSLFLLGFTFHCWQISWLYFA